MLRARLTKTLWLAAVLAIALLACTAAAFAAPDPTPPSAPPAGRIGSATVLEVRPVHESPAPAGLFHVRWK